jgi:hypothetical protein
LYKLGIDNNNKNVGPLSSSLHRVRPRSTQPSDYSFQESLKADYGLPAATAAAADSDSDCGSTISAASTSSSASTCKIGGAAAGTSCKKRKDAGNKNNKAPATATIRCVSFDAAVTVHPIPLRSQYSNRIRNSLWTPVSELQENAARNCVEFAAENWDWRQAAEDDDMVVYHGEKIHPIHFVVDDAAAVSQQLQEPPLVLLLQHEAPAAAAATTSAALPSHALLRLVGAKARDIVMDE